MQRWQQQKERQRFLLEKVQRRLAHMSARQPCLLSWLPQKVVMTQIPPLLHHSRGLALHMPPMSPQPPVPPMFPQPPAPAQVLMTR